MAKTIKTSTILADSEGKGWVEAQLSQAQVNRLIKAYERAGVSLTAYGSPNQLLTQVEEIEKALNSNKLARPFMESGRLQVIGVGF